MWAFKNTNSDKTGDLEEENETSSSTKQALRPHDWASLNHFQRGLWFMEHNPPPPPPPFEPMTFFFYGTLMAPEILRSVLQLENEEEVVYRPAATQALVLKMWNQYPALTTHHRSDPSYLEREWVPGLLYEVKKEEHLRKLVKYEGESYFHVIIRVKSTAPGDEDALGMEASTFIWAKPRRLLTDGKFDLEAFRKSRLLLSSKVPE